MMNFVKRNMAKFGRITVKSLHLESFLTFIESYKNINQKF